MESRREALRYHFKILFIIMICFLLEGLSGTVLAENGCLLEVTDWKPRTEIVSFRPTIYVTFRSQCGAEIDVNSAKIWINDAPIDPTVSGSGSQVMVSFTPDYDMKEEADHNVKMQIKDINGVVGEKTWFFWIPMVY